MAKELIWDPVRKKRVALTPEEGVRQWLIKELVEINGYPMHMLSCEYSITINTVNYRGDLVVFGNGINPLLIAECKAPSVIISKSTFEQVLRYNLALKANYLMVTNGHDTYLAKINSHEGDYSFIQNIPKYNELSK
jgi:hypothetical protein